jgi:hypothetical protein
MSASRVVKSISIRKVAAGEGERFESDAEFLTALDARMKRSTPTCDV